MNVFTKLNEEIERCLNAWLTPARNAQVRGIIADLVEDRYTDAEAMLYHAGKRIQARYAMPFHTAVALAAKVLEAMEAEESPVLINFEKQLEQATANGGSVFALATPPAEEPASTLSARPLERLPSLQPLVSAAPPTQDAVVPKPQPPLQTTKRR